MNKNETLLDVYYQDYSMITLINILLMIFVAVVSFFACYDSDTNTKIMMIAVFFTVFALISVYQYYASRVYFNLKNDIKHKRTKTEKIKVTEIKREIVLAGKNGSYIDQIYGEGFNRYKICFVDESENKNFVRLPLHFLNAIALRNRIGNSTVEISYYEKSKVLIMFHEEVPKKAKRIPKKSTLNHLIKIPNI